MAVNKKTKSLFSLNFIPVCMKSSFEYLLFLYLIIEMFYLIRVDDVIQKYTTCDTCYLIALYFVIALVTL